MVSPRDKVFGSKREDGAAHVASSDKKDEEQRSEIEEQGSELDIIYESRTTRIYHLIRDDREGGKKELSHIARKVLTNANPFPDDVCSLHNELHVTMKHLSKCPGVRSALSKVKAEGLQAIDLDWAEGITLQDWIAKNPIPIDGAWSSTSSLESSSTSSAEQRLPDRKEDMIDRIRLAREVAKALSDIHKAGVVHNDISADNIIVDVDRDKDKYGVKIIDFGFATPIEMNESDDDGAKANDDLHSLGLLFDDLLVANDAKEGDGYPKISKSSAEFSKRRSFVPTMVDSSLTESNRARSLWRRDTSGAFRGTPLSVLNLISDLTETGEDINPYNSAHDVVQDLEQMLDLPDVFLYRTHSDQESSRLDFTPDHLYGRDEEKSMLLDAYHRSSESEKCPPQMVLVYGYSGTGKSALVHTVHDQLTESGGYFISGKFDQLQRIEPYSALIVAFTELCDLILEKDDEVISEMSAAIKNAVGAEGKVLTDVIPKLKLIIGEQTDVAKASGIEAHNRFNFVFRKFVTAISKPSHPVVLFLDDLQWADAASLDLIRTLATDRDNASFIIVGCYRDNEVKEAHPFAVQIREIEKKNVPITRIEVRNLSMETVNRLVSDSLCLPQRLTIPLTEVVHRKTSGNAFFVLQFLRSLRDEEILRFSSESLRWEWDEVAIHAKNITDNVVELMSNKIRKLPSETQHVLKVAAAIGNYFDVSTLKTVLQSDRGGESSNDKSGEWKNCSAPPYNESESENCDSSCESYPEELEQVLESAIGIGLIDQPRVSSKYKFTHDRVQQAAYFLVPETERGRLHFRIGNMIISDARENDELENRLFLAVDQLNRGAAFIKTQKERTELAKLNLRASDRAVSSSAFVPASAYLKKGIGLLGEDHWEDEYDLSLELFSSLLEAEYCNGRLDEAQDYVEVVLKHATSFDDKFRAYSTRMKCHYAQGELQASVDTGFHVLSELGEPFPPTVTKRHIVLDMLRTKLMLRGKTDSELSMLPPMESKSKIAAMQILCVLFSFAYVGRPEYVPLVTFRMMRLSLRYGACNETAFGFAIYGTLLTSLGDRKGGYRFGRLSLSLLERFDAKEWLAHVYCMVYTFIFHWSQRIQLSLEPMMSSYQIGLEAGDMEYAMYSIFNVSVISFVCGLPLAEVEKQMQAHQERIAEHKQDTALSYLVPFRQCVLNLMGRSRDPLVLTGDAMDQDQLLKIFHESKNTYGEAELYVCILVVAYFFGNYKLAGEMIDKTRNVEEVLFGRFELWVHAFYAGLASFALAKTTRKKKWFVYSRNFLKKMKKWARNSPDNCLQKLTLLQAEQAALKGNSSRATKCYDAAIACASRHQFIQDEALAYERAALFFRGRGDQARASHHFARAHQLYLDWGAQAKADRLQVEFSSLASRARKRPSFQLFLRGRTSVSPENCI